MGTFLDPISTGFLLNELQTRCLRFVTGSGRLPTTHPDRVPTYLRLHGPPRVAQERQETSHRSSKRRPSRVDRPLVCGSRRVSFTEGRLKTV